MQKLKATAAPFSSTVGAAVRIHNADGDLVATLPIMLEQDKNSFVPMAEYRKRSDALVAAILAAFNAPEPLVVRQVHELHTWAQPGDEPDRTFILRFSDPDCREQLFQGEGADIRAAAAWDLYSPSWNVYLFGTVPALPR